MTKNLLTVFKTIDPGLIIAAALALFAAQALFMPGLPTTADMAIHLYRTLEYGQAWGPGVMVPRWAPNLAFGYGYPLFLFAPPLPYWLALLLHSLGLNLELAFKTLIILIILLYAIGMYLLARDLWRSAAAGLVAAIAFALAPFALREAFLVGGNVPQLLAIGLFPWTLWAITRAAAGWRWTAVAGLFYSGIILSHLFQALVFTPAALGFGLLRLIQPAASRPSSPKWRRLAPLFPLPLGLLLTAFFWLPAFVERAYTRAQADVYLQKSPFYVRFPGLTELTAWIFPLDARAANPYVPLTLGVVTLLLAACGLAAGVALWFPRKTEKTDPVCSTAAEMENVGTGQCPVPTKTIPAPLLVLFFALLAAAAIFLTLPLSQPVWETITILQVAEFPWRLLGLANLGLAALAGGSMLLFPARLRGPALAGIVLLQLAAVAPLLYPVTPYTQFGQPTLAQQIEYERRSQSIGTTTLGEYLPQTVTAEFTGSPLVPAFAAGQNPERLDRASLPPGASAQLLAQSAVTHRYRLATPAAFTLRVRQFDFPGWRATLNNRPAPIRPEPGSGLILVDIPPGQHTLTLHFGETPVRVMALVISGGAAALLAVPALIKIVGGERASSFPAFVGTEHYPVPTETTSSYEIFPPAAWPAALLIAAAALWLTPALRPWLTVNSPPGAAMPAQQAANVEFNHGLRLIGVDLGDSVVKPGQSTQVVLYWQAEETPIRANLQPFVHLDRLNDGATLAGSTNYTPGDVTTESVLPTFHWDTARYVRDEYNLRVPSDAPPQAYAVRVGLINPNTGRLLPLANGSGDTAQVAVINVAPHRSPPPLAQRLDATFSRGGDAIRLVGFEQTGLTASRLEFSLAWQTVHKPSADYTVFAQLLDLGQNLAAGYDNPPLGGAYPVSTWLPGQTIIDSRHIPLNGLPPGDYQLIVGLYDPATDQRLTTPSGANFAQVGVIRLK